MSTKFHENGSQESNVLKGMAAGIVGGLVASWTMNQFQSLLSKLATGEERPHGAQSQQQESPEHGIAEALQERGVDAEDDNAAIRAANVVSEFVLDHRMTKSEKELGGLFCVT